MPGKLVSHQHLGLHLNTAASTYIYSQHDTLLFTRVSIARDVPRAIFTIALVCLSVVRYSLDRFARRNICQPCSRLANLNLHMQEHIARPHHNWGSGRWIYFAWPNMRTVNRLHLRATYGYEKVVYEVLYILPSPYNSTIKCYNIEIKQ